MKAPALVFAFPIALAAACGGDDSPPIEPDAATPEPDADDTEPDADDPEACSVDDWSAPNFEDNAADALALRSQLDALKNKMETDEGGGSSVRDELVAAYEAGDLSLADVVTGSYDEIIGMTFTDFVALVEHLNPDLVGVDGKWTGGGEGREGGVVNERGLDGAGNEPVQLLEKGLFGAAQYNYALTLTEGDITPETIDALAALWGADAELTADGEIATNSAGYAHSMGFFADTAAALTAAKSYAANSECGTERDEAVTEFFRLWEQALFARAVYYVNAAGNELATAMEAAVDPDNATVADGLHELSEGLGLAFGLLGVADPDSGPLAGAGTVVEDADIEAIMGHLGFDTSDGDTLSVSTTAEIFVNDEEGGRDAAQTEVEGVIKDVFDLEDADIEGYYDPTAG